MLPSRKPHLLLNKRKKSYYIFEFYEPRHSNWLQMCCILNNNIGSSPQTHTMLQINEKNVNMYHNS